MHQDQTWHAGRPRPWPHCVRWGPTFPPQSGIPQFSVRICCGQMVGWIKMPHGRKIGLNPSDIVLDGDPAPRPPKGGRAPNFRSMSIVDKRSPICWALVLFYNLLIIQQKCLKLHRLQGPVSLFIMLWWSVICGRPLQVAIQGTLNSN